MLHAALLAVLVLVLSAGAAHAYIDPGTGSILLQGLIGGLTAGVFIARLYWRKIKDLFAPHQRLTEAGDASSLQRDD